MELQLSCKKLLQFMICSIWVTPSIIQLAEQHTGAGTEVKIRLRFDKNK